MKADDREPIEGKLDSNKKEATIAENGKEVYCVLDWKSDSLDAKGYSNEKELTSHTNNRYSIQRVLYSVFR